MTVEEAYTMAAHAISPWAEAPFVPDEVYFLAPPPMCGTCPREDCIWDGCGKCPVELGKRPKKPNGRGRERHGVH